MHDQGRDEAAVLRYLQIASSSTQTNAMETAEGGLHNLVHDPHSPRNAFVGPHLPQTLGKHQMYSAAKLLRLCVYYFGDREHSESVAVQLIYKISVSEVNIPYSSSGPAHSFECQEPLDSCDSIRIQLLTPGKNIFHKRLLTLHKVN